MMYELILCDSIIKFVSLLELNSIYYSFSRQCICKFNLREEIDNMDYFMITYGNLDHSGETGIVLNNCKVN